MPARASPCPRLRPRGGQQAVRAGRRAGKQTLRHKSAHPLTREIVVGSPGSSWRLLLGVGLFVLLLVVAMALGVVLIHF